MQQEYETTIDSSTRRAGGSGAYDFQREYRAIDELVSASGGRRSDDTYEVIRQSSDSRLATNGRTGIDRYTAERRIGGGESSTVVEQRIGSGTPLSNRRGHDSTYTVQRREGGSGILRTSADDKYTLDNRGSDSSYTVQRRNNVGSSTLYQQSGTVEPTRSSKHYASTGHRSASCSSRPLVLDIYITLGYDRHNRSYHSKSYVTDSSGRISAQPIRSTATIDNVHYVDLNFESGQGSAKLTTDGTLHSSSTQRSTGF
jgi:hypothetical protein